MEENETKRSRFTSTIDKEQKDNLKELSLQTRIPQSRLLDEALEDLVEKYEERGFFKVKGAK